MRRLVLVCLVAILIVGMVAPLAHAGSSTDVALGLAAFAVFNQIVGPFLHQPQARAAYAVPLYHHHYVVYTTRQVVYTSPPPPPPSLPTVVQYPHGRYELRGDGWTTAYHWVWIPNPPPPPPAPPVAPSSP